MDLKKLEKLVGFAKEHNIHEIEVEEEGVKFRITLNPPSMGAVMHHAVAPHVQTPATQAAPSVSAAASSNQKVIKSPFVGTFYSAPSPTSEPFVIPGKKVKKGDKLCIVEAMKLMNEIECENACTIKEVLAKNGDPVQFDQALFIYE